MSKSAFVSIVGRPSSGKSTLLNSLCKAKVSIVSAVPQTTRAAVRGIVTEDDCQLVFIDTPGLHESQKKLNLRLAAAACAALADCDITLYLIDATRPPGKEEEEIVRRLAALGERRIQSALLAAVNKIDAPKAAAETCVSFLRAHLAALPPERIIPVSALRETNLDVLRASLRALAPEGVFYYDGDCYTDQSVPFRVAEIVREKCFLMLREELPHALYVNAGDSTLKDGVLYAHADIRCERESQKGMIVGKGGAQIKKIRMAALADLKKIFDWPVKLELRVKTDRNWRQNDSIIKAFT